MTAAAFSSLWGETRARVWAYVGVGVLGGAFSFGLALTAQQRDLLRRHIDRESADIGWTVFLKEGADRESVEENIRSFPGIQSIRFVSRDEAYGSLQKDDVLSQSLTLTGRNPLPDAFDVRWSPLHLRADYLDHVMSKIQTMPGVEDIGFDRPRVRRLDALQKYLYALEAGVAVLLWTAAFVGILLAGKLLFFPGGPWPGARLSASLLAGALGGALGTLAARTFEPAVSGWAFAAGAAAGLLAALLHDAFQSP